MLFAVTVQELDGRVARAQRTRQAVVDALIGLLEDGHVQPTTAAIAARAGVAERTIFQHFSDRDALFLAVGERQTERLTAMWEQLPRTGPLEERLDAFVDQRARILEAVTPVRRGALLMEPFSEAVSEGLSGFRKLKRKEAERVFATELDALPARERDAAVAALGAAVSWAAWESLRRHQGLSVERARAAMRRTVAALLGA
jgi:TetR/AcrR family transcriptional regulator, regulator of autoinduction and epiphytic fitness